MIVVTFERVMPRVLRAIYRNERCEIIDIVEHGQDQESYWAYMKPVLGKDAEFEADWQFDIGRAKKPETIIKKILAAA